jgi:hypothetical protein
MLASVAGLGLGIAFSQFPEYAQQYEQRLGGAVDELRTIVADFDRDATRFGLSRPDALKRYEVSPDDFLVARGVSMERTLARYAELSAMLADLQNATPVQRVAHLGDYLDTDIGQRALENFQPAVPVTVEGVAWGLGGWVIGYLVAWPLLGLLTLPFRWRRGQVPARKVQLRRRPRVPETAAVTIDEVAEARRQIRREVEPDRAVDQLP